jgi:hypothetical protein
MTEIPALTVMQPYASAIAADIKPVENRGWAPGPGLIGRRILIHAGKGQTYLSDPHAMRKVRSLWIGAPREFVTGAFVGHARLKGWVLLRDRPVACPWSFGPICWLFEDAVEIEPIPWTGAQRVFQVPMWRLPAQVAKAVAA